MLEELDAPTPISELERASKSVMKAEQECMQSMPKLALEISALGNRTRVCEQTLQTTEQKNQSNDNNVNLFERQQNDTTKTRDALSQGIDTLKNNISNIERRVSKLESDIFFNQVLASTIGLVICASSLIIAIHVTNMMLIAIAAAMAVISFSGSAYGFFTLKLPVKTEEINEALATNQPANCNGSLS